MAPVGWCCRPGHLHGRFWESGPADVLAKEFGFTPEKVVDKIEAFLQ